MRGHVGSELAVVVTGHVGTVFSIATVAEKH